MPKQQSASIKHLKMSEDAQTERPFRQGQGRENGWSERDVPKLIRYGIRTVVAESCATACHSMRPHAVSCGSTGFSHLITCGSTAWIQPQLSEATASRREQSYRYSQMIAPSSDIGVAWRKRPLWLYFEKLNPEPARSW